MLSDIAYDELGGIYSLFPVRGTYYDYLKGVLLSLDIER